MHQIRDFSLIPQIISPPKNYDRDRCFKSLDNIYPQFIITVATASMTTSFACQMLNDSKNTEVEQTASIQGDSKLML